MPKSILETIVSLSKRVGRIPQLAAAAIKQKRRRFAPKALEVERLDRIRNPSRYLGKD